MKTIPALLIVLAASAHAESYANLNCSAVRIDAKWGAEMARGGEQIDKVAERITAQGKEIDRQRAQSGQKPMSIADKLQMKLSVTDGYNEAMRSSATIEQIAAQAGHSCFLKKYK